MDKKILDLAHKTAKDLFSKYLFPWESEEDIRKREKLVGDSLLVCLHLLYNYESDFCDFSKCDFILDEISHAEKIDDKSLKALKCETEIYQLLQESHEMKNCLGKKQPSLFFKVEREMIERRNEEIKEMEIYKDFDFTFFLKIYLKIQRIEITLCGIFHQTVQIQWIRGIMLLVYRKALGFFVILEYNIHG